MKFNVEVSVTGGVTGHRVSLLKSGSGRVEQFDTVDAAEGRAREYRETRRPYATAIFSARAVPVATCIGCDQPISVHPSIEDRNACESSQQTRVRAELDAADAAEPTRDRRMLARNAGRKVRR